MDAYTRWNKQKRSKRLKTTNLGDLVVSLGAHYFPESVVSWSKLCEVIIEVQTYRFGEKVMVHTTLVEFLILIKEAVLTQSLSHVQVYMVVFPGVTGSMGVIP